MLIPLYHNESNFHKVYTTKMYACLSLCLFSHIYESFARMGLTFCMRDRGLKRMVGTLKHWITQRVRIL